MYNIIAAEVEKDNYKDCVFPLLIYISVIQDGSTPLYVASQEGHTDVVDTLIRAARSQCQLGLWGRLLYYIVNP